MQIKTIIKFHFSPIKWAKLKSLTTYTDDEVMEKEALPYITDGYEKQYDLSGGKYENI